MAYDNPIPGFGTNNVTNLRLFESQPINEFNLDFFNEGNFDEVRHCKIWDLASFVEPGFPATRSSD